MSFIGIIGGSGLDDPNILKDAHDEPVATLYGELPSPPRVGTIAGKKVCLIARHGREHTVPPSQINYRAIIATLKKLGCTAILSTTAVGSLREDIHRGDLVVLDQFIDFTRHRAETFHETFAPHSPVHCPMAEPFDASLRARFIEACRELGVTHHATGTVVTIEGPRFSTRAESNMFRLLGADVINMSIAPECILANEAGIPYASVAMSTDYDCWKTDEPPATWEQILDIFSQNARKVTDVLVHVVGAMS